MKKSVGLVIITQERSGIYSVLLQRRAEFNSEIGGRESYPRCLQVSCHGGVEEGEDFLKALHRELREELGTEFAIWLSGYFKTSILHIVLNIENNEEQINMYATFVPKEHMLTKIKRGKDVGGLIYISETEVGKIVPTTPDMRENGAPHERMFASPYAIEAIRKGFAVAKITEPKLV